MLLHLLIPFVCHLGMVTGAEDLQELTETLDVTVTANLAEGTGTSVAETGTGTVSLDGTETGTLAVTVTETLAEIGTETLAETGIGTLAGGVTWDEMTVTVTVASVAGGVWTWMTAVAQHVLMKEAPGGLQRHHHLEKGEFLLLTTFHRGQIQGVCESCACFFWGHHVKCAKLIIL